MVNMLEVMFGQGILILILTQIISAQLSSSQLNSRSCVDTRFFKRMRARYPDVGSASEIDELISSAQNLVSGIFTPVVEIQSNHCAGWRRLFA